MGAELLGLWKEYEDGSTPEACLVKDLDKFDMIFQAYEYEKGDNGALSHTHTYLYTLAQASTPPTSTLHPRVTSYI